MPLRWRIYANILRLCASGSRAEPWKLKTKARNECVAWMISQEDLQRFEKKYRRLISASHVDRERLRFICGYVFPSSHESLLRTRESKRSRRLTKSKWRARAKSKSPERSPLTQ